jgi:suppressor for copper-sensitivity B
MIQLRRFLALLLLATGVWLAVSLAGEISEIAAGAIFAAACSGALLLGAAYRRRQAAVGWAAAVFLLATPLLAAILPAATSSEESELGALWRPYDAAALTRDVAEGRVVFVHVTARWCLTCQANQRLVLDREPVRSLLAAPGIDAMRADWTRPDPRIAALLKRFNRYGIPFDAVFGPATPEGDPLSEILTSGAVGEALTRAAARPQS